MFVLLFDCYVPFWKLFVPANSARQLVKKHIFPSLLAKAVSQSKANNLDMNQQPRTNKQPIASARKSLVVEAVAAPPTFRPLLHSLPAILLRLLTKQVCFCEPNRTRNCQISWKKRPFENDTFTKIHLSFCRVSLERVAVPEWYGMLNGTLMVATLTYPLSSSEVSFFLSQKHRLIKMITFKGQDVIFKLHSPRFSGETFLKIFR